MYLFYYSYLFVSLSVRLSVCLPIQSGICWLLQFLFKYLPLLGQWLNEVGWCNRWFSYCCIIGSYSSPPWYGLAFLLLDAKQHSNSDEGSVLSSATTESIMQELQIGFHYKTSAKNNTREKYECPAFSSSVFTAPDSSDEVHKDHSNRIISKIHSPTHSQIQAQIFKCERKSIYCRSPNGHILWVMYKYVMDASTRETEPLWTWGQVEEQIAGRVILE